MDPGLTLQEASARRDFTINSMMLDPRTGEVIDPHGGMKDLVERRLRHTSDAFVEDPLRVLRGMQFVGRFRLTPDPATVALCRKMVPMQSELPVERVREEWWKWATLSEAPSMGLAFAMDAGWLDVHPELTGMRGVEQDPEWHPEGDVWAHTSHAVDALASMDAWRRSDERTRGALMLAVLLHDAGKATHTRREWKDGRERVVSPGHEVAGVPMAEAFMARLGMPNEMRQRVPPLVGNHMAHLVQPTARAIRRLSLRLAPATIDELCEVMTADASGRPPRPRGEPEAVRAMRTMARGMALEASVPRPLVLGRHLVARGWEPGPRFKAVLELAFHAQLDGEFEDEAGGLRWLDARLRGPDRPA
jgi:tRNA nucleotidyltransferase (CCA-adding enzyme)